MNRRVLNTKSVMLRFMFKKILFPIIGTVRVYQHLAADNFCAVAKTKAGF